MNMVLMNIVLMPYNYGKSAGEFLGRFYFISV